MSRKEIKEQIIKFGDEARAQIKIAYALMNDDAGNEKTEILDKKDRFLRCVHCYVCAKFFLSVESDNQRLLIHLAEDSIEQAIRMKIPFAKDSETATTCGAAGSAAVKVALLMVAVQKDLHVHIEPQEMAFIKNTLELGEIIWNSKKGSVNNTDIWRYYRMRG